MTTSGVDVARECASSRKMWRDRVGSTGRTEPCGGEATTGPNRVPSVAPTFNLLLPGQRMNASIDPLSLVNTHGAFGSVDREWHEVALDGTTGDALSGPAEWLEHECQRKPGDRTRRPCLITPC